MGWARGAARGDDGAGGGAAFGTLYVRRIRTFGLLTYLPARLRRALLVTRPIDWLTSRTGFAEMVEAVAPFLLRLTPQEIEATLSQMRPEFADALTQPGLLHSLPAPMRNALLPPTTDDAVAMIEDQIVELTAPTPSVDALDRAAEENAVALDYAAATPLLAEGGVADCGGGGHTPPASPTMDPARAPHGGALLPAVGPRTRRLRSASFDASGMLRTRRELAVPGSPFERGVQRSVEQLRRVHGFASELFSKRLSKMVGGRFGKLLASQELTATMWRSLSGWPLWGLGIGSAAMIAAQLRFSRNAQKVLRKILRKLLLQLSLLGMITTVAGLAIKRKLRLALENRERAAEAEARRGGPRVAELVAEEGGGARRKVKRE